MVIFRGEKTLVKWCTISKEFDDLGLTKAQFRMMCHIARRCGPPRYVCHAGIRRIADVTRTHPVYVRWLIDRLVQKKLILRIKRPGRTSELRMASKIEWLMENGLHVDEAKSQYQEVTYEETKAQSHEQILWGRLLDLIPTAPKIRYEKRMRENPRLFEAVLADVEERVKRGANSRYTADRLEKIRDVVGLFEFSWKLLSQANGK